jgi:hypothetical protein
MTERPNPLSPDLMTPEERIREIAEILALGLIRMRLPKSSPLCADGGERFVDFSPGQSGHAASNGERL